MCLTSTGSIYSVVEDWATESPDNWKLVFGKDTKYLDFEAVYHH